MTDLRSINFDLDGTSAAVNEIEMKFVKKAMTYQSYEAQGLGEEEKQQLLDDIDRELNKSQAIQPPVEQDERKPRNYHPPESPVRRVYENGVEVGGGGWGQGGTATGQRPGSAL